MDLPANSNRCPSLVARPHSPKQALSEPSASSYSYAAQVPPDSDNHKEEDAAPCNHFGCPWDYCVQTPASSSATQIDMPSSSSPREQKRDEKGNDAACRRLEGPWQRHRFSQPGLPCIDSFDHDERHKYGRTDSEEASRPSEAQRRGAASKSSDSDDEECDVDRHNDPLVGRYHPKNYLSRNGGQRRPYPRAGSDARLSDGGLLWFRYW